MKEVLLLLPERLLNRIDDFRFERRFESRLKAIRHLLEKGLDSEENKSMAEDKNCVKLKSEEKQGKSILNPIKKGEGDL